MCKVGRQRFECLFIPKEGAHRQGDKKSWLPWKAGDTNSFWGALRSFGRKRKLMLHGCQSDAAKDVIPFKIGPDHEYAHLFHFLGELVHNLPRGPRIDISRTLLIKHESQRIRANIHRSLRVFQIRDSANLDPGHENQLSAISSWFYSALGTEC